VELAVGLAVGAGAQAFGQEAAGFVAADRAAGADHVAGAGVDLDRRAAGADAEFDDPLLRRGPVPAAAFLFGLAALQGFDLRVYPVHPEQVPGAQGRQAVQIGRQVIESTRPDSPSEHAAPPGEGDGTSTWRPR
jgi:hypothetical protein